MSRETGGYIPKEALSEDNVEAINPERKEIVSEYDPMTSVRRDFNEETIVENKDGQLELDSEFKKIFHFYREAVNEGTLLNVGAGSTHLHYMLMLEDKLSHITALDLSPGNIQVLQEYIEYIDEKKNDRTNFRVTQKDFDMLQKTAEAVSVTAEYGDADAGLRMKNLSEKSKNENGSPDLVVDDMYELGSLGERKFDNILISFALYIPKDGKEMESVTQLFSKLKEHLNPGGKIIFGDIPDFYDEDIEGSYNEDSVIKEKFTSDFKLDKESLIDSLTAAGFSEIKVVNEKNSEQETESSYIFCSAINS